MILSIIGDNNMNDSQNITNNLEKGDRITLGYQSSTNKRGGFTIAELLVATFVFITFLAIAMGSFSNILRMQRLIAKRIATVSSLNIVLEQIQREIRTSYDFSGDAGDAIGVDQQTSGSLSFTSPALSPAGTVSLALVSKVTGGMITRNGDELTPSNIDVKKLSFVISQIKDADKKCGPWVITISATAIPSGTDYNTPENTVRVETTIASRVLPSDVKNNPHDCKL